VFNRSSGVVHEVMHLFPDLQISKTGPPETNSPASHLPTENIIMHGKHLSNPITRRNKVYETSTIYKGNQLFIDSGSA
jgi:hypothetical protein